jgi:hypothetical protein
MKLWHIAAGVGLLLVIGIVWLLRAVDAQRPHGSDTDQIKALVAEGNRAAIRRDAGTLGRLVSNNYKDSFGMPAETIRRQAAAVIGRARRVDLAIDASREAVTVDPDGRHGSVTFPVNFQATGGDAPYSFQGTLTLRLAKEPVRYFLVFPGEEWRVIAVDGYAPDFLQ